MRSKYICYLTVVLALSSLFAATSLYAKSGPQLNNGKKWRIGYYEGGPYSEYTKTMRTLVLGLIELGWITRNDPPDYHGEQPSPYWQWLVNSENQYLSFKSENCYSANWDEKRRAVIRAELLGKLAQNQLDLVLAMGTWAGQDLANDQHSVPIMVLSTSNPIQAGIIKDINDSGLDHVTARVDPDRYLRQLRMFHRIVGFNRLGIAFEDTPDGRIYSALSEVYQVAGERGFAVTTCEVDDTTPDIQKSDAKCLECFKKLADTTDGVYVTALTCVDRQTTAIADIFIRSNKPSFSLTGSKFVEKGMMLSISNDSGYAALGKYNATKFGKILNGTKPGSLSQLFQDPLDIAINLKTAKQIGFQVPESIRRIATETYGE